MGHEGLGLHLGNVPPDGCVPENRSGLPMVGVPVPKVTHERKVNMTIPQDSTTSNPPNPSGETAGSSNPAPQPSSPPTPPTVPVGDEDDDDNRLFVDVELEQVPGGCITCGIEFAMPKNLTVQRRKDGKTFHCPNGHSMMWSQPKVKADREKELQKQLGEASSLVRELRRWIRDRGHTSACKTQSTLFSGRCDCGWVDLLDRVDSDYGL